LETLIKNLVKKRCNIRNLIPLFLRFFGFFHYLGRKKAFWFGFGKMFDVYQLNL